jgi:hypothetical protein
LCPAQDKGEVEISNALCLHRLAGNKEIDLDHNAIFLGKDFHQFVHLAVERHPMQTHVWTVCAIEEMTTNNTEEIEELVQVTNDIDTNYFGCAGGIFKCVWCSVDVQAMRSAVLSHGITKRSQHSSIIHPVAEQSESAVPRRLSNSALMVDDENMEWCC